ncbi:MAG: polymer-forming cytoskeletal protein [Alphaproteobacteria bacterium]|nr:MAG: polymer-forming cytoskeletal protein [Alphaproteobacteria bacterium]
MFSKSKDDPTPAVEAPAKSLRPGRPAAGAPSIIGADVHIVGNLATAGEIQLDGSVEGDIQAGALTMGESGVLKGTLVADNVVIRGEVSGAIRARTVVLERSAKISGDVFHETLSIEAGARIDGKFTHSQNPGKSERPAVSTPKPEVKAVDSAPKAAQGEMAVLKGGAAAR